MDRSELAGFLRDRRGRVQPADVGLEAGRRRRTPGLRREEVAWLAGMSVDYYIRLEQARGPRPSRQVLGALARALRLTDDEHTHLLHLAGEAPTPPGLSRDVPAGVLHLLDRLGDTPAVVLDAKFDVLAWNAMAAALFTDFSALPARERNLLRWHLSDGASVTDPGDADRIVREMVADLRAAAGRHTDDPGLPALVAELAEQSERFAHLWSDREIKVQRSSVHRMLHPVVGPLELDSQALMVSCADQRLLFYTAAPGTPSHDALQLLRVVGVQNLDPA
ncbi:helix-turn-helix transcriptional regulator [Nocardiopsis ganjiahuensis]|uniref:helix-turn-helix transcriptional regulator n=1 Tax=Nocardiopsis ganjiahuensis TaxID=239984 RepID=UPI000374B869|nr:helix-turn-helix transcriptional regulator [Nocardiopsis ganjiahuensis]